MRRRSCASAARCSADRRFSVSIARASAAARDQAGRWRAVIQGIGATGRLAECQHRRRAVGIGGLAEAGSGRRAEDWGAQRLADGREETRPIC